MNPAPRPPQCGGGLLLVISGPSGAGKTTITEALRQRLGGIKSVSTTTRPRAAGEVDGRDYTFVTRETFQDMVDRGVFLEHAQVYGKDWYGTPREPVERHLAQGRLVILEIDVQGALQVKQAVPEAYMLFILPPDEGQELLRRLRQRGRDDEAAIDRRHREAQREIQTARTSGAYDAMIVNDDLNRAIGEALRLVRERLGDRAA